MGDAIKLPPLPDEFLMHPTQGECYTADKMHAHAAAVSAAKDAEIAQLRAEVRELTTQAMFNASTIERLQAEVAGLREDAERYRWLRDKARATSEHWGGRWSLVIEGPAPGGNAPPASIDAAIDAARQKGEA